MCDEEVKSGIEEMIARETGKSPKDDDLIGDLRMALSLFATVGDSRAVDGLWEIVARRGLYDLAEFLLARGCRDGSRLVTDYDAVMEAVAANDIRMVRLLAENSFELNNVTNVFAESALTIAAENGNEEIFFFLVEKGAKLHNDYRDFEMTCDPEGEEDVIDEGDLLSCAIEGRSERIIRFLVPLVDDLSHWWPRTILRTLEDADGRAMIYDLGIEPLSNRIRQLYRNRN